MALKKIEKVTGRVACFAGDDVDTDRIIPARYLKCVTFDGLGEFLFYDVLKTRDGKLTDHPMNKPERTGAKILLVGNNFGCGSSREHAPQAIYRAGFEGVIGLGFAEIFFGNSTTLGIPCVTLSPEDHKKLWAQAETDAKLEVTIDLTTKVVKAGSTSYPFQLRDSARNGLVNGKWDPIGDLLDGISDVEKTVGQLPYMTANA